MNTDKYGKDSRARGYRLRDLKNGAYQIHCGDGTAFEGPELAITKACVELGIQESEVQYAKTEMRKFNHDWANFGVNGTFLYTGRDDGRNVA